MCAYMRKHIHVWFGYYVTPPGQEDIESLTRLLLERAANLPPGTPPLAITPIYAALPPEQQLKAFQPAPSGARKVRSTWYECIWRFCTEGSRTVLFQTESNRRMYSCLVCVCDVKSDLSLAAVRGHYQERVKCIKHIHLAHTGRMQSPPVRLTSFKSLLVLFSQVVLATNISETSVTIPPTLLLSLISSSYSFKPSFCYSHLVPSRWFWRPTLQRRQ